MRKEAKKTVHVGIKVEQQVKEEWEALARADRRSISNWILCQVEAAQAQAKN